jgi:diguanylate cyclase
MGLGGLLIGSVLHQHDMLTQYGWLAVVSFFLWPHIAYLLARYSADPFRAEIRNLLIDSAMVGLWVPLMQFNLLPSVVLAAVTTYDKFSTGIKRLWLYSLPGMLAPGCWPRCCCGPSQCWRARWRHLGGGLHAAGHHGAHHGGQHRQLPADPHRGAAKPPAEGTAPHRRPDRLVISRAQHWQEQASPAARRVSMPTAEPACLLMIDIDHFKPINDTTATPWATRRLRPWAGRSAAACAAQDCAGRYGGDEFAVVCATPCLKKPWPLRSAFANSIEALRLPGLEQLRLTTSIGLAPAKAQTPHPARLAERHRRSALPRQGRRAQPFVLLIRPQRPAQGGAANAGQYPPGACLRRAAGKSGEKAIFSIAIRRRGLATPPAPCSPRPARRWRWHRRRGAGRWRAPPPSPCRRRQIPPRGAGAETRQTAPPIALG